MKRTENPILKSVLISLRKASKSSDSKIWLDAARFISKSQSGKPEVNIGKISNLTRKDDIVLIPGKVLGDGNILHPVVVGAYSFTKSAVNKINVSGGKALRIPEFLEKYPSGKGVKLIGG